MRRRFQFSLRALLVLMLTVAVACAIWVRLTVAVKVGIAGALFSIFIWLGDLWGFGDIIAALLPPYGDPPEQKGPRYIIKWRRRGEKESRK